MKRIASCLCEKLCLSHEGEVTQSSICHCHACQKRSGSVYGAQVLLPKSETTISGPEAIYEHVSDEGNVVRFHFCPTCGGTLYWEITAYPKHCVAAVGCFADKDFPAPGDGSVGNEGFEDLPRQTGDVLIVAKAGQQTRHLDRNFEEVVDSVVT